MVTPNDGLTRLHDLHGTCCVGGSNAPLSNSSNATSFVSTSYTTEQLHMLSVAVFDMLHSDRELDDVWGIQGHSPSWPDHAPASLLTYGLHPQIPVARRGN